MPPLRQTEHDQPNEDSTHRRRRPIPGTEVRVLIVTGRVNTKVRRRESLIEV
jgi:hypothetical protein